MSSDPFLSKAQNQDTETAILILTQTSFSFPDHFRSKFFEDLVSNPLFLWSTNAALNFEWVKCNIFLCAGDYQQSKQFFNKWNIQAFRDSGDLAVIHWEYIAPPDSNQFNNIINCLFAFSFCFQLFATIAQFGLNPWHKINSFQICSLWLYKALQFWN